MAAVLYGSGLTLWTLWSVDSVVYVPLCGLCGRDYMGQSCPGSPACLARQLLFYVDQYSAIISCPG